jgi:hypothetical protein
MSASELSFAGRIARALRRCRALLSSPERFDRLAQQISHAEENLKAQVAETTRAMGGEIKREFTAQLSFSVQNLAQRTAAIETLLENISSASRRNTSDIQVDSNGAGSGRKRARRTPRKKKK